MLEVSIPCEPADIDRYVSVVAGLLADLTRPN
jgi:hypothetical protein